MSSKLSLLVLLIAVFLMSAVAQGCMSTLKPPKDSYPRYVNITRPGGEDPGFDPVIMVGKDGAQRRPDESEYQRLTSLNQHAPQMFIDNWRKGKGVLIRSELMDDDDSFLCGISVEIAGSQGQIFHGHLLLFQHFEGKGPAGRGDYLVEIGDDRLASASGGRLAMQYEAYKVKKGLTEVSMYAWVMILSEQPLTCDRSALGGAK